jgi:hypothetical protein
MAVTLTFDFGLSARVYFFALLASGTVFEKIILAIWKV